MINQGLKAIRKEWLGVGSSESRIVHLIDHKRSTKLRGYDYEKRGILEMPYGFMGFGSIEIDQRYQLD